MLQVVSFLPQTLLVWKLLLFKMRRLFVFILFLSLLNGYSQITVTWDNQTPKTFNGALLSEPDYSCGILPLDYAGGIYWYNVPGNYSWTSPLIDHTGTPVALASIIGVAIEHPVSGKELATDFCVSGTIPVSGTKTFNQNGKWFYIDWVFSGSNLLVRFRV